jgi:UDP-glucose 4-epimerase
VRDEPLKIYGDGSDVRAWCYVSDLVDAVEAMLANKASYGQSFNIGNPEARCDTVELAETLIRLNGGGRFERVARTHSPIPMRYPDIGLARDRLGFAPAVGLKDGLRRVLAWFREVEE